MASLGPNDSLQDQAPVDEIYGKSMGYSDLT